MSVCQCEKCLVCDFAHNGINGRYCEYLECYVEHAQKPYCETKKKNEDERN